MKGNLPLAHRRDQFIEAATKKHNNKFDYSLVQYVTNSIKVEIVCPIHGKFLQRPASHLSSKEGCYTCGKNRAGKSHRMTTAEFVTRGHKIHNNYYDYSAVEYIGAFIPVIITCPVHGNYSQIPNDHLFGMCGCKQCGYKNRLTRGEQRISDWLATRNIPFEIQKQFPELVGNQGHPLRYDFYLPQHHTIIEFDGPHHETPTRYAGTSQAAAIKTHTLTREYDERKIVFARKQGMQILRIPYFQLKNIKSVMDGHFLL